MRCFVIVRVCCSGQRSTIAIGCPCHVNSALKPPYRSSRYRSVKPLATSISTNLLRVEIGILPLRKPGEELFLARTSASPRQGLLESDAPIAAAQNHIGAESQIAPHR